MWFAQISDMHITPQGEGTHHSSDPGPALARCIEHVGRADPAPAAVIATGDLVNAGSAVEYARLRGLLAAATMPVYVLPGNHDERGALRNAFADHRYLPESGPLHYSVDLGPLRLLMLDTVVPGCDEGTLDRAQLDWI